MAIFAVAFDDCRRHFPFREIRVDAVRTLLLVADQSGRPAESLDMD